MMIWQNALTVKNGCPTAYFNWLNDNKSFMQRLKRFGIQGSKITVLSQSWGVPSRSEKQALALEAREYCLIREVLIGKREQEWMYARTILPRMTLTGQERILGRLQTRALGSVLFNHPLMERRPFVFAKLKSIHTIYPHTKIRLEPVWARRSVFTLHKKKLLLTEIFLPDLLNQL